MDEDYLESFLTIQQLESHFFLFWVSSPTFSPASGLHHAHEGPFYPASVIAWEHKLPRFLPLSAGEAESCVLPLFADF